MSENSLRDLGPEAQSFPLRSHDFNLRGLSLHLLPLPSLVHSWTLGFPGPLGWESVWRPPWRFLAGVTYTAKGPCFWSHSGHPPGDRTGSPYGSTSPASAPSPGGGWAVSPPTHPFSPRPSPRRTSLSTPQIPSPEAVPGGLWPVWGADGESWGGSGLVGCSGLRKVHT